MRDKMIFWLMICGWYLSSHHKLSYHLINIYISHPYHLPSHSDHLISFSNFYKNRGFGRCLVFKKFPAILKKYHNDMKDEILIKPKSSSFRFFMMIFWDEICLVWLFENWEMKRKRNITSQANFHIILISS